MINMVVGTISKYLKNQNQDLENKITKICKDSVINIPHMDIKGCYRRPLRRNVTSPTKRVIVKFVNKAIYYSRPIDICGESVRICRGKVESGKFLSWSCCSKIFHGKDLTIYQECSPESLRMISFWFSFVVVNFSLYRAGYWVAPWIASYFWVT